MDGDSGRVNIMRCRLTVDQEMCRSCIALYVSGSIFLTQDIMCPAVVLLICFFTAYYTRL